MRLALWIVVRVSHNDKIVDLTSYESGVIDLKLPVGDYTLISAAERDGTPLAFIHEQEMRFTIRKGKTTKFGVGVIETKEQQDSKFGRLVAKLKFTDEGRSGAPSVSKVKVRLQYGENFYTIPFNEFGIINEKLPTGKYTLVSASADGTPVLFAAGQAIMRSSSRERILRSVLSSEIQTNTDRPIAKKPAGSSIMHFMKSGKSRKPRSNL